MKKNILFLTVIAIILAIVLIFCVLTKKTPTGYSEKMNLVKVSEVTRSVFYSPQYVAINKGFFEKNGIEIDLITGQGSDAVMTSVLSGQVDIGFAGPETSIYVYNEGKEDYTQIFAQMTKRDGAFLIAREKSEKFNFQDLKGKTIIPGRKGGMPYMTFEYVLKKNGLDTKNDLILDDSIKFDLMAGAFSAGNADYVTLFEPTASMTELQEKGYIVASIGKEAGEIPYTAYCAKKSYIEENEDIIQGFTNAIYEGEQWVKNHTAREIAESVKDFFPDTDLEILETAIQSYIDIDAWNENPIMKEESFNRLEDVMIEAGELKQKVPYEKIINNHYAEKCSK